MYILLKINLAINFTIRWGRYDQRIQGSWTSMAGETSFMIHVIFDSQFFSFENSPTASRIRKHSFHSYVPQPILIYTIKTVLANYFVLLPWAAFFVILGGDNCSVRMYFWSFLPRQAILFQANCTIDFFLVNAKGPWIQLSVTWGAFHTFLMVLYSA